MKTALLSRLSDSPKWIFLSLIVGLSTPHISLAMSSATKATANDPAKSETKAKLQQYTWYDGNQKRSVWLNPELLAEFRSTTPATNQSNTEPSSKKANTTPTFIRFLAVKSSATALKSTDQHLSPVFHTTASLSGTKKALPGNVIVQMKPDWTIDQIHTWFQQQNVTVIQPLTFAPNAFLIQSNAGLESLNLANRLYETGDVVLASPNWWQERAKR